MTTRIQRLLKSSVENFFDENTSEPLPVDAVRVVEQQIDADKQEHDREVCDSVAQGLDHVAQVLERHSQEGFDPSAAPFLHLAVEAHTSRLPHELPLLPAIGCFRGKHVATAVALSLENIKEKAASVAAVVSRT